MQVRRMGKAAEVGLCVRSGCENRIDGFRGGQPIVRPKKSTFRVSRLVVGYTNRAVLKYAAATVAAQKKTGPQMGKHQILIRFTTRP